MRTIALQFHATAQLTQLSKAYLSDMAATGELRLAQHWVFLFALEGCLFK